MWVPARRGLSAAAHLQFLEDIMHVILDRGGTDAKPTRNVLVGMTLLYEPQDFVLARSEGRQRLQWVGFLQKAGEALVHRRRDVRCAVHRAFRCVLQCAVQFVGTTVARGT